MRINLPNTMTCIDDKLIKGPELLSPITVYRLKQNQTSQVMDLRNSPVIKMAIEKMLCKIFHLKYINYNYPHRLEKIPDTDYFEKVCKSIVENKDKTYIHCKNGKRRTGVCVAYYSLQNTDKTREQITQELKSSFYKGVSPKSKRRIKYKQIFNEFVKKYLT